jgi:hypothetical protein
MLSLLATFEGRVLATSGDAALAARFAGNTADDPIALIAQGLADAVVLPATTDAYVDGALRCQPAAQKIGNSPGLTAVASRGRVQSSTSRLSWHGRPRTSRTSHSRAAAREWPSDARLDSCNSD